jgi:hypothetical protein
MYIVIIGWLYVALMMSVAEATNPQGTLLGAVFTFLIYGLAPLGIVVYIMGTPARKRAIRRQREAEAGSASAPPDGGSEPAADPVAPVRKEP